MQTRVFTEHSAWAIFTIIFKTQVFAKDITNSRYSVSLQTGRSGDQIPVWTRFSHSSRLALGLTQPAVEWVPGLFPVIERPGCGVDHPPKISVEVKERVVTLLLPLRNFKACSTAKFMG